MSVRVRRLEVSELALLAEALAAHPVRAPGAPRGPVPARAPAPARGPTRCSGGTAAAGPATAALLDRKYFVYTT